MRTGALQPSLKVQCDEVEIEYQYDKDGRVTRYSISEVDYEEHRAVSSEAPTRSKYEVPVSESSKRPLLDVLLSSTRRVDQISPKYGQRTADVAMDSIDREGKIESSHTTEQAHTTHNVMSIDTNGSEK